ncbi:hypothetical protein [Variovorax sp. UC74_104]|uniref:hypothetical protein n=1 Tax=Variovorax sp. UC74_104 TaxID=3374555 RepID=UPI0037579F31
MNTDPKPTTSPSPVPPTEAEVRADDLEKPPPDDAAEDNEATETRPGEGENVPGFLKPGKR